MNPAQPQSDRRLAQLEGGGHAPVDWSPDDRTILLGQGVSVNESYVWLVDVTSGEKTLLAPPAGGERGAYADTKFSRDGRGIYLSTDEGSEFKRLAYLDLATKRTRYLTSHIPWDVEEFALSADGKLVAFVVNRSEEHTSELQSLAYLVCRLLLEKKKKKKKKALYRRC